MSRKHSSYLKASVDPGATLLWYADATGGTPLSTSTILMPGNYYAAATDGSCESDRKLIVVATNNALHLDGFDDFVTLAKNPFVNRQKIFTIEAWIKPDDSNYDGGYHAILGAVQTGGNNQRSPSFYIFSAGRLTFDSYAAITLNRYQIITAPTTTPLMVKNAWSHVAIVNDGTNYTLYVNGKQVALDVNGATVYSVPAPPQGVNILSTNIYAFGRVDNNFAGLLDEVRFWNVARTPAEIAGNMNVNLTGAETGLVSYYTFNQGIANGGNTAITNLYDTTPAQNTGLIRNLALTGSTSNFVEGYFAPILNQSSSAKITVGSTIQLTHTTAGGTWSSSSDATASVNSSTGLVTGVSGGTAVITYSLCGLSTTYSVTVGSNLAPTISQIANVSTCSGTSLPAQSFTIGDDISPVNSLVVTATSSNTALIPNNQIVLGGTGANRTITLSTVAGQSGTATITITATDANNASSTMSFIVTVATQQAIPILSGTQNICQGLTTTFSSTIAGGTWSSSDLSLAAVNSTTGVVTGISSGTATITYTLLGTGACPNVSALRTVIVSPIPNAGVLIGNQNICVGSTSVFASTVAGGIWSSSDTSIATINSTTGVVVGVSSGAATISYTAIGTGGCAYAMATKTVMVSPKPVLSITNPVPVCSPALVDLTLPAVTAGSMLQGGVISYWLDTGSTIPLPNSSAVKYSGTYYIKASTASGCVDIKPVTVTINPLPNAPIVTDFFYTQNEIAVPLPAIADAGCTLNWYDSKMLLYAAVPTPSTATVGAIAYFVSQTNAAGCEGTRSEILVTVNSISAKPSIKLEIHGMYADSSLPTGVSAGDIINYDFIVTNTGNVPLTNVSVIDQIVTVTGGNLASLAIGETTTIPGIYTITQADIDAGLILNLAAATGTAPSGTVTFTATLQINETTPAPTGSTIQTLPIGATLADIVVEGQNIQWYSTSAGKSKVATNTPLPLTTVLVNNTTYYASQTINGIQSTSKLPVTVNLSSLSTTSTIFSEFKHYPNPVKNRMTLSNASVINDVFIYDLLGKILLTKNINSTTSEIDMSSLINGVYFMKVKSGNQEKILKIVKE